jgi:hypothetical protein
MSPVATRHFRALGRKRQRFSARVVSRDRGTEPPEPSVPAEISVVDLGLGGACLELEEKLEPGREITLGIDLPGLWEPLELRAEVVWRSAEDQGKKALTGVRFLQPSGKSLRLLAEALANEHL